jgi:hypothetical protein
MRWGTERGRNISPWWWIAGRHKASGKWPRKWVTETAIGRHSASGRKMAQQRSEQRLRAGARSVSMKLAWG